MKFSYSETFVGRYFIYCEISVRRNIRTPKIPTAELPSDEFSLRRNFFRAKTPYGKISYGELSHAEISYGEISGHGFGARIFRRRQICG